MYQVGGVVGNILIGYLSDQFLKQVCSNVSIVCGNFITKHILQDSDKMCEHPRAPALFIVSLLLMVFLHMFNSTVVPTTSEVYLLEI